MSNELNVILAVLGGVGVAFGIYSVVKGIKNNAVDKARNDGIEEGKIQNTLTTIGNSLEEVKKDVKELINTAIRKEDFDETKKKIDELDKRVTVLEKKE